MCCKLTETNTQRAGDIAVQQQVIKVKAVGQSAQGRCRYRLLQQYPSCLLLQVAGICVDALTEPAAANKVVEIISEQREFARPSAELFANVQ